MKKSYGFRILADSLEIYDGYDAVRLLGAALKEAHGAGMYTMDDISRICDCKMYNEQEFLLHESEGNQCPYRHKSDT